MAVVLTLKWPGYTKAQYDQLLELADWENEPARNGIFHVVWWEGDTLGIVDVWESQQDWQNFLRRAALSPLRSCRSHRRARCAVPRGASVLQHAGGPRSRVAGRRMSRRLLAELLTPVGRDLPCGSGNGLVERM
jgi:hypothetical protein